LVIVSATVSDGHEALAGNRLRVPRRLLRLASDERLVDALRGGSEAAFEVIYTRHHRGVLSFCRHMVGSVEEAEDAVQHTFLAAYRDLVGSRKPIRLRPWLYTIARNRCLSVLRARGERPLDEPLEPATEHLSNEVERRDDLRALLGDLADLPPDQRAALVLAELGDMSHDEIGGVLGCPREKVKALVFQARSSLIASRTARETPCEEIRQQLANLRGGALRRTTLRRHLRECEGCREFREQVVAQRSALALILPVAPTLGLKASVLGAAGVTAAAGGGSAVVASVVAVCVLGGGTAAVDIARDDDGSRPAAREPRSARAVPAAAAPAAAEVAAPVAAVERRAKTRRGAGPTDHGRPGSHRAVKRRKGERRRSDAVLTPAVAVRPEDVPRGPKRREARPVPGTGNGSKAAPPKAGPKLDKAAHVRGPKLGKAPKAKKVPAAAPKAEKTKPEKKAKPEKAPAADEPGEPAPHNGPPDQASGSPGRADQAPAGGSQGRADEAPAGGSRGRSGDAPGEESPDT
jgi:RNA polymerase sigma factor (sigma-70 family)